MKKILFVILAALVVASCVPSKKAEVATLANPLEWSNDAVMYEVNVRQFTPEGTFNAFAGHLPRLKALGVEILWFMPIHPIGEKNRKGTLGSYYSIRDYKAVNPEFGTIEDFKSLVNKAHEMGFKVLIDCVANHSSWDNVWIENYKDWYTQDSLGNIIPPVADWSDVADLNYNNAEMRAAMLDAMKFWVKEANIDGYRCDYAGGVPTDFWETARVALDSIKPVFMLAENEDALDLLNKAFDCNYGWTVHHLMNEIYKGEKSATDIQGYFAKTDSTYPAGKYILNFTSNHDENSWQGTEYERLGASVKAFAALSFTLPGMPLIYTGQEAGLNKRLLFFEKDEIDWKTDTTMTPFYAKLIDLKQENPALWNGAAGSKINFLPTSDVQKLLVFAREKENNTVLVVMNLSGAPLSGTYKTENTKTLTDWNSGENVTLAAENKVELQPWEYRIYTTK